MIWLQISSKSLFTNDILFTFLSETATAFNADADIKLFNRTFRNLNIDKINNFVIAQVSGSTALNPNIAQKMNIFHIACRNHCLNLGCKDMEMSCPQLKEIADKTQEIHRKIKASNKLSAVLENAQASSCALDERVSAGKLKLSAATCRNSLDAMLDSHKKSIDSIWTVIQ